MLYYLDTFCIIFNVKMLNLDSLKLEFSSNLMTFEPKKFNKTIKEIEDEEKVSYQMKPAYLKTGLKNISVNESSCLIEFSSKLLPGMYQEMINKNTIESYLDTISSMDLIKFNSDEILNLGNVRTCDVTNNIPVESVPTYVNSLLVYKLNDKYKCDTYINESIIFNRKAKTRSLKEQLTVYNKYPELLTAKNKEFRKEIDLDYFKNILRFESRFHNFELMRNSFKVKELTLSNILNSNAKVNYNILNRITDIQSININTFNNFKTLIEMKQKIKHSSIRNNLGDLSMIQDIKDISETLIEMKKRIKHSKIRNIQGDLSILNNCNDDIELVKLYFKTNSTANNSKYIRHYKQLIKVKNEIDSCTGIDERVNEMKDFLKAA